FSASPRRRPGCQSCRSSGAASLCLAGGGPGEPDERRRRDDLNARAARASMQPRTEEAIPLMMQFAERTGLVGDRPQRRYLWTDAFAVCNFLGLAKAANDSRYTELALELVQRVHHVLGRHRGDDQRTGWISGLTDEQGEAHPTRGGLRIGKPLAE